VQFDPPPFPAPAFLRKHAFPTQNNQTNTSYVFWLASPEEEKKKTTKQTQELVFFSYSAKRDGMRRRR